MSTKTDEWEEEYEKLAIEMNLREETISGTDERGRIKNFIIDLRTRHDTYWKERVRKATERARLETLRDLLTPSITNEDNLK